MVGGQSLLFLYGRVGRYVLILHRGGVRGRETIRREILQGEKVAEDPCAGMGKG